MKLNSRIPVIALPYSERQKAVPKELLVDYDTGNIYVVSATDKSVIFNITSKILERLESLTADKIIVNVEGVGEVNLVELIGDLKLELDEKLEVTEIGKDSYLPKSERYDGVSIESKYGNIQIKSFESAENGMIPQKFNNEIRWIFPPDSDLDSGSGTNPGTPDSDDGLETKVFAIEPVQGKIFLRASRRLITNNLNKDCTVILPRVLDQYTEIYWNASTFSDAVNLNFQTSVLFNTSDHQPSVNSYNVYRFSTWDAGETWLATVDRFKKEV